MTDEGTINYEYQNGQGTAGWRVPGPLLKVSGAGHVLYVDCHADGSLTERSVHRWDEPWRGTWSVHDDELAISVGAYVLRVRRGSTRGTENRVGAARSAAVEFFVLPVVAAPDGADVGPEGRCALVKVPHRGVIHAFELLPGGAAREYGLLAGWSESVWAGAWESGDETLVVEVPGYRWHGRLAAGAGVFHGRETHPGSPDAVYPAICVRVLPEETRHALKAAPPDPQLFTAHGYDFYSLPHAPRGYFASLLEARKFSATGSHPQRFAAKCVRTGVDTEEVARREIALAGKFSATDGLIAVFESFVLPRTADIGAFAGCTVQIMELGETDLARFSKDFGPMPTDEVLTVARDLGAALAALHEKFGYVHSDLRGANVIGRRTGNRLSWRLADFNVTTPINPRTGWAPLLGTTDICLSPSMVRRLAQSPAHRATRASDDVWALGVLLAQCWAGATLPLGRPADTDFLNAAIEAAPGPLAQILAGCLTATGAERWTAARVHRRAVMALT